MRHLSRLLLLALLTVVIGFYPLLAPTPHRIDHEHFELIRVGMKTGDVETVLGVSPGSYDGVELEETSEFSRLVYAHDLSRLGPGVRQTWLSRNGVCVVRYSDTGHVTSTLFWRGCTVIVPPWQRWWKAIRQP